MGNSYILDGTIKNIQRNRFQKKDGSGEVEKVQFTLIHRQGNRTSFLLCDSWSQSISKNILEGMFVELTTYIPYTESYIDKMGAKKTITKIEVKKMALLDSQDDGDDFINLSQGKTLNMVGYNDTTNQYEQFTMSETELEQMVDEFNNKPPIKAVNSTIEKARMIQQQKEIIASQPVVNDEFDGGHIDWNNQE